MDRLPERHGGVDPLGWVVLIMILGLAAGVMVTVGEGLKAQDPGKEYSIEMESIGGDEPMRRDRSELVRLVTTTPPLCESIDGRTYSGSGELFQAGKPLAEVVIEPCFTAPEAVIKMPDGRTLYLKESNQGDA